MEKNSNPHIVGKGRNTLIAISDNYKYNHLILHQNWTSGSFIKVSCNVEPENISMNFSYYSTLVHIVHFIL